MLLHSYIFISAILFGNNASFFKTNSPKYLVYIAETVFLSKYWIMKFDLLSTIEILRMIIVLFLFFMVMDHD